MYVGKEAAVDKAEDLVGVSLLIDAYGREWSCLVFDHHLIDAICPTKALDGDS